MKSSLNFCLGAFTDDKTPEASVSTQHCVSYQLNHFRTLSKESMAVLMKKYLLPMGNFAPTDRAVFPANERRPRATENLFPFNATG